MRSSYILIYLTLSLISTNAFSADIKISNDQFNRAAIFISGSIEKGDYKKVVQVSKKYIKWFFNNERNVFQFILNSKGGDVEEAIKIALLFRKSLAQVYVWGNKLTPLSEKEAQAILSYRAEGWVGEYATQNDIIYSDERPLTKNDYKKCYSACVLMFLGGAQKQINDNFFWLNGSRASKTKDIPVIGLHRPYFSKKQYAKLSIQEAEVSYKKLEKMIRLYLEEIGATRELVDRMFKSSSNEIDLVPDAEFRKMFHFEEPFYEEWLLAKCGETGDGRKLLSKDDFLYQQEFRKAQKKEIQKMRLTHGYDKDYLYMYKQFLPKDFSREKYDRIISTIKQHNIKVNHCTDSAVREHQINMFSEK